MGRWQQGQGPPLRLKEGRPQTNKALSIGLEAIAIRSGAMATRLGAVASGLEAIATSREIANKFNRPDTYQHRQQEASTSCFFSIGRPLNLEGPGISI